MAKRFTRIEIRDQLSKAMLKKQPILITTAGIGLASKFEQQGQTDMVAVTGPSILGMDGHDPRISMLPVANINRLVRRTIPRISPLTDQVPIMAGIFAGDPTTEMRVLLRQLEFLKVSAITNIPSVGILSSEYQKILEQTGVTYQQELDVLTAASNMGFFTVAMAYSPQQALWAARAGVDAVCCDLGFTYSSEAEDTQYSESLEIERAYRMARAVRAVDPGMLVLLHGGPIADAETARRFLKQTGASGLFLSSAVERIPVEKPLRQAVQDFKAVVILEKEQ